MQPRLGTADAAAAEEVGSHTNKIKAPTTSISSDSFLEFVRLAAPPSVAAVKIGTSGACSTVVPPDTVSDKALTHVFKIYLINIISDIFFVRI